ncbi:MAG TPA: glycosyltransferase family 2 protein [Kiritimatiellia bacterium]|jgi:glycosyltransferase involved in cell wall biosynthesis|nr:glycosyltransferase family 2 protein [Kiritimatiellia bacterium]HOR97375.1 glycosyltransferase family 2 protein [Kiritimatiellia bacterium]HPW74819.1 glycosyltransferase family 2 protein [Kiritimatiellia bacterium]HRU18731.1 glycosyltransferase family 2 protein [Kiritimatiellia bacterium]
METQPELTIVIPVYNEGENILRSLREIQRHVTVPATVSIVYDFEEDTTLAALKQLPAGSSLKVRAMRNAYGRGVLNAIKTGLEAADTELIIVTMADLSDPPEVMNEMVRVARETGAAIVCASRYMRGGQQIGGPKLKGFLSRTAGMILYWVARLPTHDPTNSFKLYRKSFLSTTTIESPGGFELGIELVVKAWKSGHLIAEVPTTWRDRVAGKSNFKLWKWLPHYLRWFFYAFRRNKKHPPC